MLFIEFNVNAFLIYFGTVGTQCSADCRPMSVLFRIGAHEAAGSDAFRCVLLGGRPAITRLQRALNGLRNKKANKCGTNATNFPAGKHNANPLTTLVHF